LLLSRYSGSEDVVFGATVSGRPANLPGVEEMVGMFINTLPVRVQMKSEEAVGKYLQRLQEQQMEVRQYEYSPLVAVQGWSEVGRGVRLFDTIMVFENYPVGEALRARSGGLDVRNVRHTDRNNLSYCQVSK
jgi:non-ribosomal peptide synthetase component F